MVEGLFVALDHKAIQVGMQRFNKLAKLSIFRNVGAEMGKAIFFSKLIIITCLIPIFAFQKVEGKMFSPLAWTLGFALLGALLYTLTLVPAMSSFLLNKNVREKHNFFVEGINKFFTWLFDITFNNKITSLLVAVAIMVLVFFSTRYLGSEFLPALDEGALWVKTQLPMSGSFKQNGSYFE
jgi:cobalt-zinc-cadmium resistance protein CzcA